MPLVRKNAWKHTLTFPYHYATLKWFKTVYRLNNSLVRDIFRKQVQILPTKLPVLGLFSKIAQWLGHFEKKIHIFGIGQCAVLLITGLLISALSRPPPDFIHKPVAPKLSTHSANAPDGPTLVLLLLRITQHPPPTPIPPHPTPPPQPPTPIPNPRPSALCRPDQCAPGPHTPYTPPALN